jgi:hypothetical protein
LPANQGRIVTRCCELRQRVAVLADLQSARSGRPGPARRGAAGVEVG